MVTKSFIAKFVVWFLSFGMLLNPVTLPAQPDSESSDKSSVNNPSKRDLRYPKGWGEKVAGSDLSLAEEDNVLRGVAFIESLGEEGKPVLFDLAAPRLKTFGYLRLCRNTDLSLGMTLNKKVLREGDNKLEWNMLNIYNACLVRTAVLMEGEDWKLVHKVGNKTTVEYEGKPVKGKLGPKKLNSFIRKAIGYDGVILDVKGDFVLVGGFGDLMKKQVQALVLKDSAKRLIAPVGKKKREGEAILQLVSQEGPYAVFKTLLSSNESGQPKVGAKVVLSD